MSTEAAAASKSRDDVVEAIREAILAGELVPGQRLVEAELCETFHVSRGTVRVALMDLTHEGFVERIANRGARVRVVTLAEALQITEVRMALESMCAGKAAARASDDDITALLLLGGQMTAAVEAGDVLGYSEYNQKLHREVVRIADQQVAQEILDQLRVRNVRHQFRLAFRPGRPQESLPLRLAVIDAISRHDIPAAEDAARAHMQNVMDEFRKLAESRQGPLVPVR